jgi:hypothetical protein
LLAQSLAYVALIAATLEYAILVRHRLDRRIAVAQLAEEQEVGLRSLVRVFLVDDPQSEPLRAPSPRRPRR